MGPEDGYRVLVDRLWPRGVRKDAQHWDEWLKDVAPSTELRRWYNHDPARYEEFRRRYWDELRQPGRSAALEHLRQLARERPLVLLTATRDVARSQAPILAAYLEADPEG
jgi:uncharacterized protein YeaO (DUF488 family)